MKLEKKESSIEVRDGKIIKVSHEEIEIADKDVQGEINMCVFRIKDAQAIIIWEQAKLDNLKKIQKDLKL